MRGEEVQLLGAVAGWMVPPDALLAQPGTHCKWATMTGGRISGFTTAMTGELFALLRGHRLLAGALTAAVIDGDGVREGLAEGAPTELAAPVFGTRVASVAGVREDAHAPSIASGGVCGGANRKK